ncbi:MAG: tetratricopeptide repeat protein [Proteobacteria bacterium]|nr:tetratricopeptide repeat protein [Pseudomonadota bacterium]MBU1611854.1 tetratricopeptide repeat protein [Pseudomonadota bacterium]
MAEKQYNNVDEYIDDLKSALAKNKECGNTLYNLGVAYISKREFMEAERYLREAVEASPKMAEANVQLGGIAMQRGDLEGCLNFNILATQQRPFFAVPWGNIGFCQLQMGEVDKAESSLKRALKYDKGFLQALATLGSVYITRGEYDEAMVHLEKAVSLESMFGPAWNNLALVYAEKGEWSKAKNAIEQATASGYEVPEELIKEIETNA